MASTVVIGGGYGGLAVAARLAKLGHHVSLVESADRLGGSLERLGRDGFAWDVGPTRTLLPAVARDLFRKSGRPLERELTLEHRDVVREHRFADGSRLTLPSSSLERQHEAVEQFGDGLGRTWTDYVAAYRETWEILRGEYLERAWVPALADRRTSAVVFDRATLQRRVRRALGDPRLREIALHSAVAEGHDPRRVPGWVGVTSYLEQRFGVWRVPPADGGMAALGAALTRRLATRKVDVHLRTRALDVVVRDGRVAAVATDAGDLAAEQVVCAVDPRRLPTLARRVRATTATVPAPATLVGLAQEGLPELGDETVLHAKGLAITISTGHQAPEGFRAWRLSARGHIDGDLLDVAAREGVDVRAHVVCHIGLSPREQLQRWGGSPWGVLWQGRGTLRTRWGPRTPVDGVYAVGAHATPGAGLPFVGLSAALVAQEIGPA